MALLKNLKDRLYNSALQTYVKQHPVERSTTNLEQAKTIGILFDCSKPENIVVVNNFAGKLKEQLKRVHLLGYFNSKKEHNFGFPYFNRKNVNWYGKPKGGTASSFVHEPLDILINAYLPESKPLEYLSVVSSAKFRIGKYHPHKVDTCDFMFKVKEGISLRDYLNHVEYYIKNVRGAQQ